MALSKDEIARYQRHLSLPGFGPAAQERLKAGSVLVIGAGGLGCPALLYLAAAGVGRIVVVDPDTVDTSNLQRQVLYATDDEGRVKVEAAAARLAALNPHVRITAVAESLTEANARALVAGHDLVLDGTDDFATRFAVNAACVVERVTLVSGAIGRWTGQVGVFSVRPCYRCFVPDIPPDAETCAAVGVVGALAGVVGSMMALEAMKLLTDAGQPLTGRLLIYDALAAETRTVRIGADPECPVCGDKMSTKTAFLVVHDYGMGGVWAVIRAENAQDVSGKYPELEIVSERPGWMDDAIYADIERRLGCDIDDPPSPWLASLIEARKID